MPPGLAIIRLQGLRSVGCNLAYLGLHKFYQMDIRATENIAFGHSVFAGYCIDSFWPVDGDCVSLPSWALLWDIPDSHDL